MLKSFCSINFKVIVIKWKIKNTTKRTDPKSNRKITETGKNNTQGLQEKWCKAEQDCFGAPETGWDFSQNCGFEVQ